MTAAGVLVIFGAALLAFGLSTVSGGGAGLLLLPLLARFLPGAQVPAALTIGTATSTTSKLALFWRHVYWPITRVFVPAAVPGVLLGVLVLKYLNPLYLEVFIGLFLVSNLTMLLRRQVPVQAQTDNGWGKLALTGFLAGFLSGVTGAVGLLFNSFYFRHGLSRDQVVATRAANELLLHLIKLVLYLSMGLLTPATWWAGAAVALGAVLATAVTRRYLHLLSEQLFRKVGYAAMVLSGGLMLASSGRALQQSQNLRASLALVGDNVEVTGWWTGGSVTVELELDEGPAIEHSIGLAAVPAPVRQAMQAAQRGRSIVKIEEVWQLNHSYYELYLNDNGQLRKLEFARTGRLLETERLTT